MPAPRRDSTGGSHWNLSRSNSKPMAHRERHKATSMTPKDPTSARRHRSSTARRRSASKTAAAALIFITLACQRMGAAEVAITAS